ncbi:hypothetical protein [Streptomyces mayteni]
MKLRLRPGSVARAEDLLTACVRECAAYVATGPENRKLVAAVGALVVEHAAYERSADRAFEALLAVGRQSVEAGEVRLARRVADTAVALRSRSKDAWRLRAEALEADGRDREAVDAHERSRALAGERDPELVTRGARTIGVGDLRGQLADRSVCVIANGEGLAGSALGPVMDGYDVVVRLDSFQTQPGATGQRVDLHAVSCRSGGPGWRRQARTRLVFGEEATEWREAIRSRLVPGAQSYLGDRSLSRPVSDPALIGESRWAAEASTGFTVARLLDHLDVSARIDLLGFTLPGQLRAEERQWLLAHARDTDGLRISLR